MTTDDTRTLLIRELRTAARGIDHSLADEPDYERFDAAVAAIEAHALDAERARYAALDVERLAKALERLDDGAWEADPAATLAEAIAREYAALEDKP